MPSKRFTYVFFISSLLVWVYLMLRAWYIPPVHDEAATFFHYINHGEFIPGYALWDANNHILNSFLGKYFIKVFGVHVFTIRMANLCFFPLYVWFLYRFSGELESRRMKYALLITGLGIHGFIEYFAYSRGYGMSMALLAGALYYAYLFFSRKNIQLFIPACLLFALATLSNLTLQNSALLFIGTAAMYMLFMPFTHRQKLIGATYVVIAVMAMLPFIRLSLHMKRDGLLYYAQDEDFWTAVILSFTQMFFDSKSLSLCLFWFLWTGILVWITGSFLLRLPFDWNAYRGRLIFPLFFFGNLLSVFAMHHLLDVNFPSDRTGMHLILYLFLGCIFLADTGPKIQQFTILVPTAVFVIRFALGANVSYSTYWKGEHLTERFWARIREESESGKYVSNPTIGGYRIRNLVWAWHNFRHGGTLQNIQYFDYYNGFEDYQLFSPGDLDKEKYDSLDTDEISGVVLARRKEFIQTELYLDSSGYRTPMDFKEEYYNLFETFTPDSFIGRAWLVEADIKLYSLATPPKLNLVASCHDAQGNVLDYEISPLHWLKKEYRPEDKSITLKIWWYEVPADTKRIVIYLWNVDRDAYTLEHASLRIYKAKNTPFFKPLRH